MSGAYASRKSGGLLQAATVFIKVSAGIQNGSTMKRSAALKQLSREHHTALVLAKRAQRLSREDVEATKGFMHQLVETFAIELEPHFRAEETVLLPALQSINEGRAVQRTLAERMFAMRSVSCFRWPRRVCRRMCLPLLVQHFNGPIQGGAMKTIQRNSRFWTAAGAAFSLLWFVNASASTVEPVAVPDGADTHATHQHHAGIVGPVGVPRFELSDDKSGTCP